jgi:hypothetical protein
MSKNGCFCYLYMERLLFRLILMDFFFSEFFKKIPFSKMHRVIM